MQTYRRRKAYWQWLGMFAAVSGEKLHSIGRWMTPDRNPPANSQDGLYVSGHKAVADKLNRELADAAFNDTPLGRALLDERETYPDPSDIQAMRDEPPATVAIVEIVVFGAVNRREFGTIQETLDWLQTLMANQVEFTIIYPQ